MSILPYHFRFHSQPSLNPITILRLQKLAKLAISSTNCASYQISRHIFIQTPEKLFRIFTLTCLPTSDSRFWVIDLHFHWSLYASSSLALILSYLHSHWSEFNNVRHPYYYAFLHELPAPTVTLRLRLPLAYRLSKQTHSFNIFLRSTPTFPVRKKLSCLLAFSSRFIMSFFPIHSYFRHPLKTTPRVSFDPKIH